MANHPHDKTRPESAAVRHAVETGDIEALCMALSVRMRRFAEEYILDYNGAAAVVRAGYSNKYPDRQAYALLRNKGVAFYVDHLTRSKEVKIVSVTPDYLIQRIIEILEKPGTRDGDKLRGIELMMRHKGMLTEKIESKVTIDLAEKQKVEEEAQSFTNTLRGLRERVISDKDEVTLV